MDLRFHSVCDLSLSFFFSICCCSKFWTSTTNSLLQEHWKLGSVRHFFPSRRFHSRTFFLSGFRASFHNERSSFGKFSLSNVFNFFFFALYFDVLKIVSVFLDDFGRFDLWVSSWIWPELCFAFPICSIHFAVLGTIEELDAFWLNFTCGSRVEFRACRVYGWIQFVDSRY